LFVVLNSSTDHMEDLGAHGKINTTMDIQEVGWGGMEWIDLAQDRGRCRDSCKIQIWTRHNNFII
jgi:hypothetical protein